MSQTVGLIIPPPEIRTIIDKTAEFVVKHGAAVEENIIQAQVNNLSFNFLKQNDPYRPYYDSKIAEFARSFTQIISEQVDQRTEGGAAAENEQQNNIAAPQNQNQFLMNKDKLLKRQEAPKEEVSDLDMEVIQQIENPNFVIQIPSQLTSLDLDIIKHTAQFVAKNGKKFLISLTEREKQNPQFDFLKPTNALFSFFISLVNSYQKIIQIKESQVDNIISNGKSKQHIYTQALRIFDYLKQKRQQEKKQSEIEKEERLLKESIDWNDFYVAETIDFNDTFGYNNNNNTNQTQDIPAIPEIPAVQPTPIEEEKPKEPPKKDIPTVPGPSEIPPQIIPDENIKIKTDYKRQQNNQKNECTKCQICGQLIPIDDYNKHLEIEMLDPKYQQLKKEQQASSKSSSTVHDPQIIQNLYDMRKYRPEIFGYAEEQYEKVIENDRQDPNKPIWDGQSATMTRTTATVAMLAQQTRRKYEEQLKEKGLLPQSDEQNKQSQQGSATINRNNKLSQLEEGVSLEPESVFLQKNPGAVTLNIRIPEDIERNAKLTGQLIKLTFQPHNTIQQIKQTISERIGVDLEQSNLKSTLFKSLKSEKSIAFYNLFNGAALELNLK